MASNNYIDVGVYFGGSSMVVAYGKPGDSADKVSVIVNEAGDRSTPAVVALNASEFSVGLPAKQNLIRNSANTIQYAKHMIGKTLEQIDAHFVSKLDCQLKEIDSVGGLGRQVAFLVNKDSKTYELSLSEAIEKQLAYLNGSMPKPIFLQNFTIDNLNIHLLCVATNFRSSQDELECERMQRGSLRAALFYSRQHRLSQVRKIE